MIPDQELIRQYAVERSESAFSELVRRHLNMVYGSALRQVNGDAHLAQDLAQTVFSNLAAKAAKLQDARSVAGWLYSNTRFVAVKAVRSEARRRAREQSLASINEMNSTTNTGWNELRPIIDETLSELSEGDREAIVLRYFESLEFSLVGAALSVSENAARMRVDRALEKLRTLLQKRGFTTTGAVLAEALAESSIATTPSHLAAGVTAAALMRAATQGVPTILQIIAVKKLILAAAGMSALVLAAVLMVRRVPPAPPPPSDIAAGLKTAPASPSPPGGPTASLSFPKGDPDLLRKLAQRHEEQVRSREARAAEDRLAAWEKKVAEFDDSLKEQPGIKKFGTKIMATLGPGETLVASGWRTTGGKNALVFVSPQWSPQVEGGGESSDQVSISSKIIEVSDGDLDRLGMTEFKAGPDSASPTQQFSSDKSEAMFESITNATGTGSAFCPRVSLLLGYEACVSSGRVTEIGGTPQHLGLQISYFPTRSADATSVDLAMLLQYAIPTGAEDTTADGQ